MFISLLVSLYMQTMYIHLEFKYNIIIFFIKIHNILSLLFTFLFTNKIFKILTLYKYIYY